MPKFTVKSLLNTQHRSQQQRGLAKETSNWHKAKTIRAQSKDPSGTKQRPFGHKTAPGSTQEARNSSRGTPPRVLLGNLLYGVDTFRLFEL